MNTTIKTKTLSLCCWLFSVAGVGLLTSCSDDISNEYYADHNAYNYDEQYRPSVHYTPRTFWMNDPNGMVYLDGEYHLFYQYNPYQSRWGYMSWGHAVSTDLIHWTELPVALYPNSNGDIFSGSIIIDKDNTAGFGANAMIAVYTSSGAKQTQSIAYSTDKGRTFTNYDFNPVMKNPGKDNFRDPKVFWYEASHQWIMSLATGQTITFYASPNLKEWTKLSDFGTGIGGHGGVWECPDLFPLAYNGQTKWVLLVSINPGAPGWCSGTQYFVGDFDGTTFTPDASVPYPIWLDYGKDNYAGVTWNNIPQADGRKLFIAWMSNWQYAEVVPTDVWRGAMTMPRQLSLATHPSGYPILASDYANELSTIGGNWSTLAANNNQFALTDNGNRYQLNIDLTIAAGNSSVLALGNKEGEAFNITIDRTNGTLVVDRRSSGQIGFSGTFASVTTAPLNVNSDKVSLSVIVDKSSVEIVVNGGVSQQTNLVFPHKSIQYTHCIGNRNYNANGENKTIKCNQIVSKRFICN